MAAVTDQKRHQQCVHKQGLRTQVALTAVPDAEGTCGYVVAVQSNAFCCWQMSDRYYLYSCS